MNLLIITQRVDKEDDILGFFHYWLEEFAKQTERTIVVAQCVGEYNLPKNVEIFSLGKEKGYSKIRQLLNFYGLLFRNLSRVDAVFVHMIPMWVLLGWPVFKIYQKKIFLWYVHKAVGFELKLAEKLIDKIFTASKESCRLKSEKIVITGHGIDTDKFKIPNSKFQKNSKFKIISVGRIAPVKNLDLLIEAAEIIKEEGMDFQIKIAGKPLLKRDEVYFEKLKTFIEEKNLKDRVVFVGAIPNKDINGFYNEADLFVNLSDTGSIDKAVLEAMAPGLLVLTSNEAFKNILPEKYFVNKNPKEIAEKIIFLSKADQDSTLREYVVKNHNLKTLIEKILSYVGSD